MSNDQMWQIFNDVNDYRKNHGLIKLNCNFDLHPYAQDHANYMANKGVISHDNFQYRSSKLNAIAENCCMSPNIENIATLWYNSQGHFENMMGNYTEMNVGLAYNNGYYYACLILR